MDFVPAKTKGTLGWLASHPLVKTWMTGGANISRGLCIYGVKGCGKSVLAASFHDELASSHGCLSALYHFWGQSESQTKCTGMVSTLLWQLMKKLSEPDFATVARHILVNAPVSMSHLLSAVEMTAERLGDKTTVYLIIDGVDESTDEWSRPDSGGFSIVSRLLANCPNIRILALGREPSLRRLLDDFPGIEITPELIQADMNQFIASELAQLKSVIVSDDLRTEVHQTLTERAGVVFLWAKLVLAELSRCGSVAEIQDTLDHLPHTLDEEYYRAFFQLAKRLGGVARPGTGARSPHLRRVRAIFSLIVAAAEPLELDELRHAHAISVATDPRQGWEDHLLSREGIIAACGDFISVSSSSSSSNPCRVHLSHSSVEEFLTRPAAEWETQHDIEYFRLSVSETNREMARACLDYLRFSQWGYPLADNSLMSLSQAQPFLSYSHKYAVYHFLQVDSSDRSLIKTLDDFISSRGFCMWIEYGFLQAISDSRAMGYILSLVQLPEHYEALREGTDDHQSLFDRLTKRFSDELTYRRLSYGASDIRTTSWDLVQTLVAGLLLGSRDQRENTPLPAGTDAVTAIDGSHSSGALTAGSASGLSAGNELVIQQQPQQQAQQIIAASSSRIPGSSSVAALRVTNSLVGSPTWLRMMMDRSMMMLSTDLMFGSILNGVAHSLPVIVVILLARYNYVMGRDDQARQLCSVALKRTNGLHNFEEAYAFNTMGFIHGSAGDQERSMACHRRARDMVSALPVRAHSELVLLYATEAMSRHLLRQGRMEECAEMLASLAERDRNRNRNLRYGNMGRIGKWEDYLYRGGFLSRLRDEMFVDIEVGSH